MSVCAVCGVGPGIGLAVARRFAREGFAVALLARRVAALAAMAAGIEGAGGTARAFSVDLTDAPALLRTLARVAAEMGAPSVLVYNASLWSPSPAMDLPPDSFAGELALDVTGALVATQAVFPAMRAAGGGTVIFTGNAVAIDPARGGKAPGLTVGKSALRALCLAMAPELAAAGIHLGTVTIDGTVRPGTAFDPDRIARAFWELHAEPRGAWSVERLFRGDPNPA